ncbi:MAG: energy transducer TonB, partial [Bacteroidota bacterium]|nr:energy transducer TonB [Bacteroidota bacterium]
VALLGAVGAGLWGWEHQPAAEHAVAVNHPAAAAPGGPVAGASSAENAPSPTSTPAPATASTAAPETADAAVANANSDAASVVSPARPAPARQPAADYAVLSPRRRAASPGLPARQPASEELAAATSTADDASPEAEAETRSDGQIHGTLAGRAASVAPAAAESREKSLPGRAEVAAAPAIARLARSSAASRDQAAMPAAPAADSAQAARKEVAVAVGKAKMANAPAGLPGNSVRVLDKPMPATPAISPAPLGGTPALYEYLRRQAAEFEPEENAHHLPGGHVKVHFVVGADGKVSNLQVVRGLRADYDAEALRIICDGPAWRPGIANGRRAALPMELTVNF